MATKSVGTIRALMEMASKKYVRDTEKGEKANDKFNRNAKKGFRGSNKAAGLFSTGMKRMIATTIALAGPAVLGSLISKTLDAADNIAKTADKVGLTTAELQELRFAAEQSGVNIQSLDIAMQRWSRRLGEAANGQGVLFKTLTDNNIALRDQNGNMRSSVDVLDDYANLIAGTDDAQKQLLLTFQAFDTEGAALVNLLRDGSEGMNVLRQEARDLGLVIGDDLLRGAEGANDALNRMSSTLKADLTREILRLAPAITSLAGRFIDALPGMLTFVETAAEAVGLISDEDLADESANSVGELAVKFVELNDKLTLAKAELQRLQALDAKLGEGLSLTKALDDQNKIVDDLVIDLAKLETAVVNIPTKEEAAVIAVDNLSMQLWGQVDAVGANTDAWERLQDHIAIMTNTSFPDISDAMRQTEIDMNKLRLSLEDDMTAIMTKGQLLAGILEIAFTPSGDRGEAVRSFLLGLLTLFEGAILASGALSEAIKLSLSGIGVAVAIAGVIALEAAKAVIRGADFGSFAEGGSFTVPGSGSTDTQRVGFMATGDEKVTIQTPAQQAAGVFPGAGVVGGGQGGGVNITIENHFDGIANEAFIDDVVLPGIEDRARAAATDVLTLKNFSSSGQLLRAGKG